MINLNKIKGILFQIFNKHSLYNLNYTADFMTDVATLTILDPNLNRSSIQSEDEYNDWWINYSDKELSEMKNGQATFLNLGGDGVYSIRITGKNALTTLEQKYCVSTIQNLGVEITSGHLHVGGAEYVTHSSLEYHEGIICIEIDNGQYDLTAYGIQGDTEETESLPDIVLVIKKRAGKFKLDDSNKELLPDIPSTHTKSNFKVGDCLKAGVKLNHQHQLYLNYTPNELIFMNLWPESRDDWPYEYEVTIDNISQFQSMDYIVVRIEDINETSKIIKCSLVSKMNNIKRPSLN